jgi:C-terminal processing protease CtpA/Prc
MLVEDKVIIWKILSDTLAQRGFRPGQEIVTIDGVPVRQYAERFVQPFMSSSTPQDLKIRTYTYSLLAGNSAKDLVIGLRDGEQTTVLRTLPRTGYGRINRTPDFDYRMLDHNIAFVALNSFERDTVLPLFEAHFEDISKADGLIIDLRLNGGGSGSVGFDILSHLTDRPFLISKSSYRASPDNLSWRAYPPGTWKSRPGKAFKKPVIVLISPMTFSAAEDFAVAFDTMKRGTLIGEPTGGSTGQPYSFKLPGGLSARVCMKRDTYPDGREFVGLGVQPHILVSPTIGDIREGRDVVLDKAINYLIAPRAK